MKKNTSEEETKIESFLEEKKKKKSKNWENRSFFDVRTKTLLRWLYTSLWDDDD